MDNVFDDRKTVADAVAGLIRSSHGGMCSGEPRGVSYPGVPSVYEVLGRLGVDGDDHITESVWDRACEIIYPD